MADRYKAETIEWLRKVLRESGLSPSEVARRAGVAATTLTRPLNNPDHKHAIGGRTMAKVAAALGVTVPPHLMGAAHSRGKNGVSALAGISVPEYDVRLLDGDETLNADHAVAKWPFLPETLASMRLPAGDLAIIEITGDAMAPTLISGDRIIFDRADVRLPGLFVIQDGDALSARRVDRMPGPRSQPPRLRISADNKALNDQEAEAGWVRIIGRVVGVIRRL